MYKEGIPVGSHVYSPKNGSMPYLKVYNEEGEEVVMSWHPSPEYVEVLEWAEQATMGRQHARENHDRSRLRVIME